MCIRPWLALNIKRLLGKQSEEILRGNVLVVEQMEVTRKARGSHTVHGDLLGWTYRRWCYCSLSSPFSPMVWHWGLVPLTSAAKWKHVGKIDSGLIFDQILIQRPDLTLDSKLSLLLAVLPCSLAHGRANTQTPTSSSQILGWSMQRTWPVEIGLSYFACQQHQCWANCQHVFIQHLHKPFPYLSSTHNFPVDFVTS